MIAVVDYHKGNLKSVERGLIAAGADAFITDDAAAIARADAIVLPGVGAFADAAATMQALGQTDVIRRRIAVGVPFLGICLGMHLMFEEGIEGAPEEDDEESTHNAQGLAILPGVVTKMPQQDEHGLSYKVPHVGWNTIEEPEASDGFGALRQASLSQETNSALFGVVTGRTEEAETSGGSGVLHQASSARAQASSGRSVRAGLSERLEDARTAADQVEHSSPLFEGIPWGTYFYFTHGYIAPEGPFVIATTTHSVIFPCAVQYGDAAFGVQFHPEKSSDAGAQMLRNFVRIVKGV